MLKGFEKFIDCLDKYLDFLNITSAEGSQIKLYSSVTLKNGTILHATNKFHKRPWFSNIAVNMDIDEISEYQTDSGICFAQVYINY